MNKDVTVRQAFVHEADLSIAPGADTAAPGAAVTVGLCGHWEHAPPCPLAPHHTTTTPSAAGLRLRILFATEPERTDLIRDRIRAALAAGQLTGPGGVATRWHLLDARPGTLRPDEHNHARRLMAA